MAHMLPLSATAGVDGRLIVWDTASLSVRATCQHPEVCCAALSCQTTRIQHAALIFGRWPCFPHFRVWSMPSQLCGLAHADQGSLQWCLQAVVGMELHPSKPLILTACLDGQLRCWDARDGETLRTQASVTLPAQHCDHSRRSLPLC